MSCFFVLDLKVYCIALDFETKQQILFGFDKILLSMKLLWLNPVGYQWDISRKLFRKAAGAVSCFILKIKSQCLINVNF